jgi:hypothetical protein
LTGQVLLDISVRYERRNELRCFAELRYGLGANYNIVIERVRGALYIWTY